MSELPWIPSYPAGLSHDHEIVRTTVWQILEDAVARWPDHPALDFMGKKRTYRELSAMVRRAANGFRALGVKPGVNVGLYLPNTPHYVVAFFGILQAGGTVVNYSPLDTEKVLAHKIEDSETDIMVTLDVKSLYPQMVQLLQSTRLRKLVVGALSEMAEAPNAVREKLEAAGHLAEIAWDDRHMTFEALLANDGHGEPTPLADAELSERVAVIQYTGGTSGQPKGAMLTHANLSVACNQYWTTARAEPRILQEGQERFLAVLPLFHIYALTVDMLFGIRMGAEIVLHARFEVEAAVRDIAAKKITVFPGVPTMFAAILHHPGIEHHDLSSLKFCGSGGAPLPREVQQRFRGLTGCLLCEGWGMTETSPTGTFTPMDREPRLGSCGLPMPGISFEFANVENPNETVPLGQRGEICVKGPNVMLGYWKNPAATATSRTKNGFFRTGDVGYMDRDGFVYIVDRTKDMLLCGGFNVYPRTIEDAIYEHPAVAEVTVIGVHDDRRGQVPKAFIKLKPGAKEPTLEELQAFLEGRVGKHEMVKAMAIRAELPKTLVGKLSKKELYEEEAKARL
ncbi:long-chain fatty acid--CoA ligase [Pendulispora albinea]|uniref:Long-chain-fatty-acid--CoA ligase n=1 Tax=Pendulispora albinea TaxID=2741071 RepID=A0ABZ2M7U6_9BACT